MGYFPVEVLMVLYHKNIILVKRENWTSMKENENGRKPCETHCMILVLNSEIFPYCDPQTR
jgi:hypothetical protein